MTGSRLRAGLGAAIVLVLVLLGVSAALGWLSAHGPTSTVTIPSTVAPPLVGQQPAVMVHVSGAVQRPGVYSLPAGARVVDALAAAAGPAPHADPDALNLVRPLTDGEQLHVPAEGETNATEATSSGGSAGHSRVNINRASQAELETLPRVGPTLAQRIIDHRTEHGPFRNIEDLQAVSGVGDQTFANLRDLITV